MQRACGAALLLVGSLLAAGCFDEIIHNPGATEGSTGASGDTSTASAGGGTGEGSSTGGSGGPSGSSGATEATDADVTGGAASGSTTVETGGGEGVALLCPAADYACGVDPWEVEPCADCQELTPLAECVLSQLRDSTCAAFAVDRCDGGCVRDYYFLRCSGDSALIQSVELDGQGNEVVSLGVQLCTTTNATYFQTCVADYKPGCADPETWVIECVPYVREECPITI